MFVLTGRAQLERAIERAKAHHPTVKVDGFGRYRVSGSAGNFYTVRCERRDGLKVVECACVAGQFGSECYHAAAALSLHVGLARLAARM
jgi:hypothetical protein